MANYWYFYLRLYYIRKEQDSFRTEMYKGLMDYVHNKAANWKNGYFTFIIYGKSPAIQQNFLDFMTICQNFDKPDLFLTMTRNPRWKETAENIIENENAIDRPYIITCIFQ